VGTGEVDAFAKMLLKTYYGNHFLNPSHSFYYSSIKRRIIMLTTSNIPTYSYLRKVAVLPMLAFILALFSIQLSAQEAKENKAEAQSIAAKQQKQAAMDQRQAALDQKQYKIDQRQAAKQQKQAAMNQKQAAIELRQAEIELRQAAMDQRQAAIDYELAINGPNENTTLNGNIIALKPSSGQKDNPLIVIDGVITSESNLKDINPNNILSINVLKGEKATAKYAEKGAYGVIEITTKKQ